MGEDNWKIESRGINQRSVKVARAFTRSKRGRPRSTCRNVAMAMRSSAAPTLREVADAGLGQDDSTVVTLEQEQAQPVLEDLHLPAHRPVGSRPIRWRRP